MVIVVDKLLARMKGKHLPTWLSDPSMFTNDGLFSRAVQPTFTPQIISLQFNLLVQWDT